MTSLELTEQQIARGYRPLAGRILLELENPAEMIGSIHVPQTAQTQTVERDQLLPARVLAIGYGPYYEAGKRYPGIATGDVAPGDRVMVSPLLKDLNKRVLMTSVTRVEAAVE